MNFKVKNWSVFSWDKMPKGLFRLRCDCHITLYDNDGIEHFFHFAKGLKWDGASIPKIFRWYLPNINEKNLVYSYAGLVHDFCYGSECVDKDLADDMFRGIMRDSGIPRRKASFAEWVVEHFADKHYGRKADKNGIRFFGTYKEDL